MHTALWVLAATSVVGAVVSLLRPSAARPRAGARVTTATPLRIGEVAERARDHAAHDPLLRGDRAAAAAASARRAATAPTRRPTSSASSDALRFKQLLGLSLDELKALLEAEEARAALRDRVARGQPGRRAAAARSSSRRSATSTASSSWSAAAARTSTRSRRELAEKRRADAARCASWTPSRPAQPVTARSAAPAR